MEPSLTIGFGVSAKGNINSIITVMDAAFGEHFFTTRSPHDVTNCRVVPFCT